MKFKPRLSMFLLTGMFLLLSFFASSCYYSWSMSGEGYEGGHVYLVKVPGRCVDYDYFESQDPMDYLKKTDLLYAYDQDFSGYEVSSERYQASLETYEELNSQGYSVGGKGDGMIWDREERKVIRFALPPGSLFRVTHFRWNMDTETKIYADVLNGPLAGKEIEVGGLGTHFHYPDGIDDLFEYPAGRTQPFWLEEDLFYVVLDPDVVQDLGRLSDEELKAKGLWLEPGTEAAKAVVKQLPEGIDLERLQKDAENNDVAALIQLGKLYYEGAGVRRDRAMAEYLFQKAAAQGSSEAEIRLAIVRAGDPWGTQRAAVEDVFRKHAEQGEVEAQFCLGLLLGYKENRNRWNPDSVLWYQKAADQGDARSMRALGMFYATSERPEMAAEWFRKAAELGDFAAQRNLGYLYLKGKGMKKDKAEARKWLEKAVAQGDSYAQELLAESFPDSEK